MSCLGEGDGIVTLALSCLDGAVGRARRCVPGDDCEAKKREGIPVQ